MTEVLAYLGLGANEGDRERNIRTALSSLGAAPGVRVVRCSKLVSSALFGEGPEQGEYLNGVAELATSLPAPALLSICRALEVAAGRRLPALRNHPRPLDLDLLLYGRETIDTRDLIVPHPRMWQRPFVLLPLRELGVDLALMPRPVRPLVVQDPAKFAALCSHWQAGACTTGLVPTMGALHPGHQSLIRKARAECDRVLVTIFVNPLQFSAGEDFAAYPRTLERDVQLCAEAGADAVFAPEPLQMPTRILQQRRRGGRGNDHGGCDPAHALSGCCNSGRTTVCAEPAAQRLLRQEGRAAVGGDSAHDLRPRLPDPRR